LQGQKKKTDGYGGGLAGTFLKETKTDRKNKTDPEGGGKSPTEELTVKSRTILAGGLP